MNAKLIVALIAVVAVAAAAFLAMGQGSDDSKDVEIDAGSSGTLSQSQVKAIVDGISSGSKSITIKSSGSELTLPSEAVGAIAGGDARMSVALKDATLRIASKSLSGLGGKDLAVSAEPTDVPEQYAWKYSGRPSYDIKFLSGGSEVPLKESAEVSVPYSLKSGETAGNIGVAKLGETSETVKGTYSSGKVTFSAADSAVYVITYTSADPSGDGIGAHVCVKIGDSYAAFEGRGNTVQEIVKSALGNDVEFSNNGNVKAFRGQANDSTHSWVVFRWKAPETWVHAADSDMAEGMTLALEFSEKKSTSSGTDYSLPDLMVEQTVYFFFQIPDIDEIRASTLKEVKEKLVALDRWLSKAGLSDDDVREGFWIKGTGTNACDALANAVRDYIFPESKLEMLADPSWDYRVYTLDGETGYYQHGVRPASFGWFNEFLGWSDTDIGDKKWTYWSQYTYNPNAKTLDDTRQWDYNQTTFGMYDMEKYRYYAVILQTTTKDGTAVDIPTPSDIPKAMLS